MHPFAPYYKEYVSVFPSVVYKIGEFYNKEKDKKVRRSMGRDNAYKEVKKGFYPFDMKEYKGTLSLGNGPSFPKKDIGGYAPWMMQTEGNVKKEAIDSGKRSRNYYGESYGDLYKKTGYYEKNERKGDRRIDTEIDSSSLFHWNKEHKNPYDKVPLITNTNHKDETIGNAGKALVMKSTPKKLFPLKKPLILTKPDNDPIETKPDIITICKRIIGIHNPSLSSNTSYIHSIIQMLIHCPPFIKSISSIPLNNSSTQPIMSQFLTLTHLYLNSHTTTPLPITNFLNTFLSHNSFFNTSSTVSHTPMQFYMFLLDSFLSELTNSSSQSLQASHPKQGDKPSLYRLFLYNHKASAIGNVFLWNTNTCTCKCKCDFMQVNHWTIDLRRHAYESDVSEMIRKEFNEGVIGEICVDCGMRGVMIRRICSLPKVMIIELDYCNMRKEMVRIEERMNLADLLDMKLFMINQTEVRYALFATVHYDNNINHYYTKIKIDNQWYKFNEGNVFKSYLELSSNSISLACYNRLDCL